MPLDIKLFRVDQGGDPAIIEVSQKKRFKDPIIVQQIIELDNAWRKAQTRLDDIREQINKASKTIGNLFKQSVKNLTKKSLKFPKKIYIYFIFK